MTSVVFVLAVFVLAGVFFVVFAADFFVVAFFVTFVVVFFAAPEVDAFFAAGFLVAVFAEVRVGAFFLVVFRLVVLAFALATLLSPKRSDLCFQNPWQPLLLVGSFGYDRNIHAG